MNDCGEGSVAPSILLPEILPALDEAIANGQSFPELPIATKHALGHFGIYGTAAENVPSAAEKWSSFRDRKRQGRVLGILASRTTLAMSQVEEYREACEKGTLGLTMTIPWTGVRAVRSSGVYVDSPRYNKDKMVDGVATAWTTSFTFATKHLSTLFHTQIQATHQQTNAPNKHIVTPIDASPDWWPPMDSWDPSWIPPKRVFKWDPQKAVLIEEKALVPTPTSPHPYTVDVAKVNEYVTRITHEARWALVCDELAQIPTGQDEYGNITTRGIILNPLDLGLEKDPVDDWLEKTTIHPIALAWLRAKAAIYKKSHEAGFVAADYVPDDRLEAVDLKPGQRDELVATDTSAATKLERDALNGLIHQLPAREGSSKHNLEQHPNRLKRLWIEIGVYLRRMRLPKGKTYKGPRQTRPANIFERAMMEIQETWTEVKENPSHFIENLPDVVGPIIGGVLDILSASSKLLIRGAKATWKGIKNYHGDIIDFRQQKKQALARVPEIHTQLQQMQDDITAGLREDVFPDISLPDSPQLRILTLMTKMMTDQLGETMA